MSIEFLPVEATPAQLIEAARSYKGLRYSSQGTFVTETDEGPKGFCDCVGLFLLAWRRLGALPSEFDPNLPGTDVSRETLLIELLTRNFARVDVLAARPGDLLQIWLDGARTAKHFALLTSNQPAPWGSLIHSCNDASGTGRVWEAPVDAHTRGQIHRVYRYRGWLTPNG